MTPSAEERRGSTSSSSASSWKSPTARQEAVELARVLRKVVLGGSRDKTECLRKTRDGDPAECDALIERNKRRTFGHTKCSKFCKTIEPLRERIIAVGKTHPDASHYQNDTGGLYRLGVEMIEEQKRVDRALNEKTGCAAERFFDHLLHRIGSDKKDLLQQVNTAKDVVFHQRNELQKKLDNGNISVSDAGLEAAAICETLDALRELVEKELGKRLHEERIAAAGTSGVGGHRRHHGGDFTDALATDGGADLLHHVASAGGGHVDLGGGGLDLGGFECSIM